MKTITIECVREADPALIVRDESGKVFRRIPSDTNIDAHTDSDDVAQEVCEALGWLKPQYIEHDGGVIMLTWYSEPENTVEILGALFILDDIAERMDDEVREAAHDKLAPCDAQEFADAYCKMHLEKFGELFDPREDWQCQ